MSEPVEDATLLLEGKEKDAPAEKAIKIGFLLDLIKDCGETKMPPMPIDEADGMIVWSAFLKWWQLGQKHLEDVYSDED